MNQSRTSVKVTDIGKIKGIESSARKVTLKCHFSIFFSSFFTQKCTQPLMNEGKNRYHALV